MQYYCYICKITITEGEYKYSKDVFGKALCRKHQEIERESITPQDKISSKTPQEISQQTMVETTQDTSSSKRLGGLLKKVVVITGKGIVKGVKTIANSSTKSIQIHRWKDKILRRMDYSLLKGLCHEKGIVTKITRTHVKEDAHGDSYYEDYPYEYSFEELVGRIKLRVKLDDIISYAKRNNVNIREIIQDIDNKKSEWQLKEFTEQDESLAQTLLIDVQKAIQEYRPARRYYQEILYQDTLVAHLTARLPERDVKIEKQRGSSRPDIIVDNIAIEIKGPTTQQSIDTIASKCMRYKMHFPGGLIIVLFDVQVNDYFYNEWEKGLKRTFPDVIVIKK